MLYTLGRMVERGERLQLGDVRRLEQALGGHFETASTEFDLLSGRCLEAFGALDDLERYCELQSALYSEEIKKVEAGAFMRQAALQQVRDSLLPDTVADRKAEGGLERVWTRVRLKLDSAKLPWYLRPFGVFAIKQHPVLVQIGQEQAAAQVAEDNTLALFREKIGRLGQDLGPQIEEAQAAAERVERQLAQFCEEQAAKSLELADRYVAVLPHRAREVASRYAAASATNPETLYFFPEFLPQAREFLLAHQTEEQAAVRYGSWVAGGYAPTADEYEKLPRTVQARWERFVRDKLLGRWGYSTEQTSEQAHRLPRPV